MGSLPLCIAFGAAGPTHRRRRTMSPSSVVDVDERPHLNETSHIYGVLRPELR